MHTLLAVATLAVMGQLPPQVTPLPPLPAEPTAQALRLPGESRRLTLEEAVALALERHPEVARARAQVSQAQGGERAARGSGLPRVGLGYNYLSADSTSGVSGSLGGTSSRSRQEGSGGQGFEMPEVHHTATYTISQLVTDFGRTRSRLRQAREGLDAQLDGQAATEASVAHRVRQAYYGLLQAESLVGVQRANLEARRASLAVVKSRFDADMVPYGDVARATASVAMAQTGLAQALAVSERARVVLNSAIGIAAQTPTEPVPAAEPEPALPPGEKMVEEACRRRPELRQMAHAVEAGTAGWRAARNENMPTLVASLAGTSYGKSFASDTTGHSLVLSLSWTPFDSGVARGQAEQVRGQVEETRALLEQARLAIAAEVTGAYQDVRSAEHVTANARVAAASARESLRIVRERYGAGLSPLVDVSDAEAALVASETDRVNAEYELSRARAALAYALGPER